MPQIFQNYIAGEWHNGETTIENISPSDLSDSIGHYAQSDRRQLDSALDAAASAQKQWAKTGLEARKSTLMNIGNGLMARQRELGGLLSREEMCAPIACVIKVDSYDEAVDVVNDTHFGLASGVITRSLARATDFRRRAQTGVVTINLPTAGKDYHVPFGGRGGSSFGPREQGRYAEEFYTTVKTSCIAAGQPD